MRRRTQIVLAVTFMAAALVSGASYIYISQILRQGINTAHDTASYLTSQLAFLATNAAPDLSSTRVDTSNPEAVRRGIAYYLGTDRDLNTMLDSVVGSWPTVYDAAILDADGKAILDTDPNLVGKKVADRPDFALLQSAGFRRKLRMVYNPPTVYDVRIPLLLNGETFGSIHVGVSTVFLRNELTPRLQRALMLSGIAVLCSLILAAGLCGVAVGLARGGSIGGLANLRMRRRWLLGAALLLQGGSALLAPHQRFILVVASYALVSAWLVDNARQQYGPVRGALVVLTVGWLLNVLPIVLNHGMPVSRSALDSVGAPRARSVSEGHFYKHVLAGRHTVLAGFGDVIPVRPLATVMSLGDIVILVGLAMTLAAAMPRRRSSSPLLGTSRLAAVPHE